MPLEHQLVGGAHAVDPQPDRTGPEGVGPLLLVVAASEEGRVVGTVAGDDPFREPLLLGGRLGQRAGEQVVGPGDHRGDAGVLHPGGDHSGSLLALGALGPFVVAHRFHQLKALKCGLLVDEISDPPVGVDHPDPAGLADQRVVTGPLHRISGDPLAHVLQHVEQRHPAVGQARPAKAGLVLGFLPRDDRTPHDHPSGRHLRLEDRPPVAVGRGVVGEKRLEVVHGSGRVGSLGHLG